MQAQPVRKGIDAMRDARTMFQRVLSSWAVDVLALRRRGWDRPCLRLCAHAGRDERRVHQAVRRAA